jgi:hypothetical protein
VLHQRERIGDRVAAGVVVPARARGAERERFVHHAKQHDQREVGRDVQQPAQQRRTIEHGGVREQVAEHRDRGLTRAQPEREAQRPQVLARLKPEREPAMVRPERGQRQRGRHQRIAIGDPRHRHPVRVIERKDQQRQPRQ